MNGVSDCIVLPDDFKGYPKEYFEIPHAYKSDIESVLIPKGLVADRAAKMARDIYDQTDFSKPFLALCVLKGAYLFFNELLYHLRELSAQSHKSCQIELDFIRLKSYMNDQSSGEVKVIGGDDFKHIEGKNVLVVEDIVDTGRTMEKLLTILDKHKPHSVQVASMLVKRTPRSSGYRPTHIGFEVADDFVIGYGLDYNEYFRDLGHVCIMAEDAKEKYAS